MPGSLPFVYLERTCAWLPSGTDGEADASFWVSYILTVAWFRAKMSPFLRLLYSPLQNEWVGWSKHWHLLCFGIDSSTFLKAWHQPLPHFASYATQQCPFSARAGNIGQIKGCLPPWSALWGSSLRWFSPLNEWLQVLLEWRLTFSKIGSKITALG